MDYGEEFDFFDGRVKILNLLSYFTPYTLYYK